VLVSDGLPTVPLGPGRDPVADALAEAKALRRARIGFVVAEVPSTTAGHAAALAEAAAGVRLPLAELAAGLLLGAFEAAA
jgi:Mg-chelatase subunit ChlD